MIMMKTALISTLLATTAFAASVPALAGDAALGKQKAGACIACHGDDKFPGIFYTLQLGGRDADKLAVKTNKYRTGKILMPIMNVFTMTLSEQDIADISAYYKSLGKPVLTSPLFKIKGDDDVDTAVGSAPAVAKVASAW
jgi:cytochrome c553